MLADHAGEDDDRRGRPVAGAIAPYAIDEFGFAVPATALVAAILVAVLARKPLGAPAAWDRTPPVVAISEN
jgi:hypothetical protein